ncbi:MAG: DUF1820 family protein [Gammaproteobacteria bacterium]|nr:DUF1820 family protein [Gammaproteobacteria bacterium]
MSVKTQQKIVFKVIFINQGKVYEVYAKEIAQSGMFGFIEVEGFIFGEKSAVVIDPSEERLKDEFNEVKRTYIPMHSIIRIDEVEKEGTAKIISTDGNSSQIVGFPGSFYNKHEKPKGDR